MRPRHKAAENYGLAYLVAKAIGDASMRPRHKAAENAGAIAQISGMVNALQ